MERQDLSRTYLAHHELESVIIIIKMIPQAVLKYLECCAPKEHGSISKISNLCTCEAFGNCTMLTLQASKLRMNMTP